MYRKYSAFLKVAFLPGPTIRFNIDYANPRKYVVGGVKVEGNTTHSENQIIQVSGLRKGMTVTIPGDDISSVVSRLWLQRYFEDVAVYADSLSASKDSVYLTIALKERPRVSRWGFSGIKSGERKDLQERLNLRRGGEFSEYVEKTSVGIIKRYYDEKGFMNAKVNVDVVKDTVIKNAIRVTFNIDKGKKVKIRTINFIGNEHLSDYKLAKSMKKTKSNKFYNFLKSKKFNAKEYANDKRNLITAFNEAGYKSPETMS